MNERRYAVSELLRGDASINPRKYCLRSRSVWVTFGERGATYRGREEEKEKQNMDDINDGRSIRSSVMSYVAATLLRCFSIRRR